MNSVILPVYFDGQQIMLDEPYPLEPNTPLTVTVLSKDDQEREDWARFGRQNLARAYGDDEPEYALADLKELNPDYGGPKLTS